MESETLNNQSITDRQGSAGEFKSRREGAPCLSPDEPPAFQVRNRESSGPVVVVCDHASNAIPRSLGSLGLEPEVLEKHVAYDIGTAGTAARLAALFDAPLLLSNYSRLVIDVNRHPSDPTSIATLSEDIVIPGNRHLCEAESRNRRETFFDPYHETLNGILDSVASHRGRPVVVSVHSFTPTFHGQTRPWHIGVLWNRDQRLSSPLIRLLRSNRSLVVGDNEPYHGGHSAGYTMDTHALANGYPHVLLEIRQDLIADQQSQIQWAGLIYEYLAAILNQIDLNAESPARETSLPTLS